MALVRDREMGREGQGEFSVASLCTAAETARTATVVLGGRWGSVGAVSERGSGSSCTSSKGGCSVRQGLCGWLQAEDSCGERMFHQPGS